MKSLLTKVKSDFLLTLEDAKRHLRVDIDDDDQNIEDLIKAAVSAAETYINKDIAYTVNTLILYDFAGSLITLNEGNYHSITSIKDGDSNDLTYADEPLDIYDDRVIITLDENQTETDVTIVYNTGYESDTLPASIRQAILIKLAEFYDVTNNGYVFSNMMNTKVFESLLNYYQLKRFI